MNTNNSDNNQNHSTVQPRLTPEELATIEQRVGKATRGKWHCYIDGATVAPLDGYGNDVVVSSYPPGWTPTIEGGTSVDAQFIANAHQDVPRMAQEIRTLWAALAVYKKFDAIIEEQRKGYWAWRENFDESIELPPPGGI